MIAEDRGRTIVRKLTGVALVGMLGLSTAALAQNPRQGQGQPQAKSGRAAAPKAPAPGPQVQPVVEMRRVPVKPTDPVAIVNNEVITRQQLADECVTRKGEEILETMVARKLIEQAMRAHKLEVSAAEIDAEIDRVAQAMAGVTREQWLRTLAKERNISPAQYAHDIIYPALALRKLAAPKVQITDQDLTDALEAEFGERLVYRLIMTRTPDHANQIWNELKKNPGGFEHLAMNDPRSIDTSTKSSGGKPINGPLQRHSYPREVTDACFRQLVDGDPEDKDDSHKPKDGDITGPIQVTEDAWIIVKREGVIPARPYDKDNPALVKQMRDAIFESKIQQHMEQVYAEMFARAAVENKLTGSVKAPSTEVQAAAEKLDGEVRLMSERGQAPAPTPTPAATQPPAANPTPAAGGAPKGAKPPVGVSPEDLKAKADVEQAIRNRAEAPAPK